MVDRREFDSLKAHCERQARQIKAKDAEIAKLKTQIGGKMKRVVNEVTHTTVNKLDLKKTYCAIYGDFEFLYKLHCVDGDHSYVWVDMFNSKCWADGVHTSPQQAIRSVLDDSFCKGVYEVDDVRDLAALLNKVDKRKT